MSYKFNKREVIDAIREVVAEKPEGYKYESVQYVNPQGFTVGGGTMGGCTYTLPDPDVAKPSCIVGAVIAKIHPDLLAKVYEAEWLFHENGGVRQQYGNTIRGLANDKRFGIDIEEHVLAALKAAQAAQDSRETWETALEQFEYALGIRQR